MLVIELVKSTGLAEIDLGLLAMGDAMHDVGGPLSGLEFHFVRGLRYEWIGCRPEPKRHCRQSHYEEITQSSHQFVTSLQSVVDDRSPETGRLFFAKHPRSKIPSSV